MHARIRETVGCLRYKKEIFLNELVSFSVDDARHPTVLSLHLDKPGRSTARHAYLMLHGTRKLAQRLESDPHLKDVSIITIATAYATRKRETLEKLGFIFDQKHALAKDALDDYRKGIRIDEEGVSNIDERDIGREPNFAWIAKQDFIMKVLRNGHVGE